MVFIGSEKPLPDADLKIVKLIPKIKFTSIIQPIVFSRMKIVQRPETMRIVMVIVTHSSHLTPMRGTCCRDF